MPAEVLIAGGGPAGLALALAARRNGIACIIADARAAGAAAADRRILALSHGSRMILERLDVWRHLAPTAIQSIHVSQSQGFGRTLLKAADYDLPALGYVIDAASLAVALEGEVCAAGIEILRETRVAEASALPAADRITARLQSPDGEVGWTASLVAWAEGAVSEDAAQTVRRDYRQAAIVAHVSVARPHDGTAFERFTPAGPIALLPYGPDYTAIIARSTQEAHNVLDLSDAQFVSWLQEAFGRRVHFTAAGARSRFELMLCYRRQAIAPRTVWLGNAAQTLHPVAGQGFNLALRDAWELACVMRGAGDPGADALLRRHAAARGLDRRATIGFTDGLVRIFTHPNSVVHHARGAGLLLLDLLPPGRDFLARRMLFGARAWA